MKVSRNWIQQYVDFDLPADIDLIEKIGAQLGGIEEVAQTGARYSGAIVVRVFECSKHENSDHLNVCLVDDGGVMADLPRDINGLVQVVCGAPNVRSGLNAVWLPPGAVVPDTFDKDPFVLGSRELRGVMSHGMLASPRELAMGDSHEGILEIHQDIAPGTRFVDAFELDDTIIDIENKMFTHRPDCFGQLGVAREVAGILGKPFTSPDWYKQPANLQAGEGLTLSVDNELTQEVPRFLVQAVKEVIVRPSPLWLQSLLTRVGARPINNIVDITNYLMLLTGQPLHAYDYDKVKALTKGDGAEITVRRAKKGETIKLLNGKTIEPRTEAIMIASGNTLIGVGGVMGGADTEVDDTTTNIILECANFNMYSIRRTAMAHGLFTDAVTRFNKGQSPLQNDRVMTEAIRLVGEVCGATVGSEVIDLRADLPEPVSQNVKVSFINSRLGLNLTPPQIIKLLSDVEFEVYDMENLGEIFVKAPFWRTDINIAEDIVEEVGRLYGFDKLPLTLPTKPINPTPSSRMLTLKQAVRTSLAKAGANEVLTYSFVHGQLLEKAGQDPAEAFQLSNALSPDLQYYRISLMPSLLDKARSNLKAGYGKFALFELGKSHTLLHKDDDEGGLPQEFEIGALLFVADDKLKPAGATYYEARAFLDQLAHDQSLELTYQPITEATNIAIAKPYQPGRAAYVYISGSEESLGIIGEFTDATRKAFKLPEHSAGFEIDLAVLLSAYRPVSRYVQLPRFPKTGQDICLRVTDETPYQTVYDLVTSCVAYDITVRSVVTPVDIYQRQDDTTHKQLTFRIQAASYEKTLTDAEVTRLFDVISETAHTQLGADRV